MVLGDALEFLKAGRRIRRMANPDKVFYIDDTKGRMNPYLVSDTEQDNHMPDVFTNFDLFADDWEITDDG